MSRLVCWLVVMLGILMGCSQSNEVSSARMEDGSLTVGVDSGAKASVAKSQAANSESGPSKGIAGREIIYTSTIRLSVDNFDPFPERLNQVAMDAGGFLSETEVERMQGARRSGRWVIRVPADNYRKFLHDVSELGIPDSVREKANDVTMEFVDLQARISGGRKLEEQIVKLLERQDGKIENILAVEKELGRVRLEIEAQEGRLRFLKDQVGLSTITVYASEQKSFVPEKSKSLSERIALEFQNALQDAKVIAEKGLLFVVANCFVIPAWLVGATLAWFLVFRHLWRSLMKTIHEVPIENPKSP